jgi:hypothetical protein
VLGRAAALPPDRLVHAIERECQEAKSFVIHGVIGAAFERPAEETIGLPLDGLQPIGVGAARLRQHFQNAVRRLRRRIMLAPVDAAADGRVGHAGESTQHPSHPKETLEAVVKALLLTVNIGRHPGMGRQHNVRVGIGSLQLIRERELGRDLRLVGEQQPGDLAGRPVEHRAARHQASADRNRADGLVRHRHAGSPKHCAGGHVLTAARAMMSVSSARSRAMLPHRPAPMVSFRILVSYQTLERKNRSPRAGKLISFPA